MLELCCLLLNIAQAEKNQPTKPKKIKQTNKKKSEDFERSFWKIFF